MESQITPFNLNEEFVRTTQSLIIFITCIEYLGRYMHFMLTQARYGIGIKLNEDCPNIPYLMFAYDCLIFCRVSKKAAKDVGYSWIIIGRFQDN